MLLSLRKEEKPVIYNNMDEHDRHVKQSQAQKDFQVHPGDKIYETIN